MPRFDRLTDDLLLEKKKIYLVAAKATHIGYKNAFIAFFWSNEPVDHYKSCCSHREFKRIPNGLKGICHPNFKKTAKGIYYGEPKFIFELESIEDGYIIWKCPDCWNGGSASGVVSTKPGECMQCQGKLESYRVIISSAR